MCNPLAVMAVAAVASAAMTGVSAASQASAQKKQAEYQAQVAANNAKVSAWQRSDALQRGEIDAQNAMRQQADLLGRQRASMAANGIDITQGSALDVLSTTRFLGQADVNTIQSNAAREAWGYEVQGSNQLADANLSKWKADNTDPALAGGMAAGSSLLSSASSYAMAGGFKGGNSGTVSPMKIRSTGGTGWVG